MANRLSADIAAARAAGMSYGKYKVLHPCVEIEEPKPEPVPGKEAKKIPCAFCGELFAPWHGRKYCSDACREEKNLIDSRNRYWKKKQEAKTNADRIRAMTDEELAKFLGCVKEPCDYCDLARVMGACTESLCVSAMARWLQQPAEGE